MRINDDSLIESYVVKDKSEAILIRKIIPIVKKTTFKTREKLEEMLKQPS